ncbi:unnamed protein product [Cunninghamella blakesleeana]
MIQTTLFNYFKCNGSTQPTVKRLPSFKQTNLYNYFNIVPKKRNLILDYFKPINKKQMQEEENKVFDIALVDIKQSSYTINCIKKNMFDPDLKYIAISYRWGELNEQSLETPDYTAHVTSFNLEDLVNLCKYITYEPDLKHIGYLWIDSISVNQHNYSSKRESILQMNQIYKNASYILAVPDLHKGYLLKNPANREMLDYINIYKVTVYKEIFYRQHQQHKQQQQQQYTLIKKIKNKMKGNEDLQKKGVDENNDIQKKKIYQFLAYLIDDWSNRTWVMSEYHIAKEKYIQHGTPLKYIFISLFIYYRAFYLCHFDDSQPFFSYHFDDDQHSTNNEINNNSSDLTPTCVIDYKTFYQFVNERFRQQSHLEMILNSNATINEDRFSVILPLWREYKHLIENKNTVSKWNLTDMTSVRLTLYKIMSDLWDKATLLNACSPKSVYTKIMLPSFATLHSINNLRIVEKYNYNNIIYKKFLKKLLGGLGYNHGENIAFHISLQIQEYSKNSKSVWTENLTCIQLVNDETLSIRANSYFIMKSVKKNDFWRSLLSLDCHDEIHKVFIPFFTFKIPGFMNSPHVYHHGTTLHLADMYYHSYSYLNHQV